MNADKKMWGLGYNDLQPGNQIMTILARARVFSLVLGLPLLAGVLVAQGSHEAALKNLKFRNIGPAVMGGRVDDFAVVESDPRIIYTGTAAGGIFKTVNGGITWEPIF